MAIDKIGLGAASLGFRNPGDAAARAGATRGASPQAGGSGAAQAGTSIDGTGLRGRVDLIQASIRAEGLQRLGDHAHRVESALAETHGLLEEIRGLIQDQRETGTINASALDAARARLATIAESITRAEARASGEGAVASEALGWFNRLDSYLPGQREGFGITDVNPNIYRVSGSADLPPRFSRDIELEVVASAHTADVKLWFYNTTTTPALEASFSIEIAGAHGSVELSFASGTTVSDVAAAINSRYNDTGVRAVDDSSRILLNAPEESGAFVSVRILEHNGIRGVVEVPDEYIRRHYDDTSPDDTFRDDSSVFTARVNGIDAEVQGNTIISNTPEWEFAVDIGYQLNTLGTFHLFTMVSTTLPERTHEEVPPELTEAAAAGANAVREANEVAQDAGVTVERIDLARADVADRRRSILELIRGPLAEASAIAQTRVASLLREAPSSGWRVDTRG